MIRALLILGTFCTALAQGAELKIPAESIYLTTLVTGNKEKWPGRFYLASDGPERFKGWFLWNSPKNGKLVEFVLGRPTNVPGRVELKTVELRTTFPGFTMCEYTVDFAQDKGKFKVQGTKFRPGNEAHTITWSGTEINMPNPAGDAQTEAWMKSATPRAQLLRELSDNYKLGPQYVRRAPTLQALRSVLQTNDADTKPVAQAAAAVIAHQHLIAGDADFTKAEILFRKDLFLFAAKEFTRFPDSSQSFTEAARIFSKEDGGFRQAVNQYASLVEHGVRVQQQQNDLLDLTRLWLDKSYPKSDPTAQWNARFKYGEGTEKLTTQSPVTLVIKNQGKDPLEGVCVWLKLKVDPAKTDQGFAAEMRDSDSAYAVGGLLSLLGDPTPADEQNRLDLEVKRRKIREMQMNIFKLGRGALVYVDKLNPGVTLEYNVMRLNGFYEYLDSVEVRTYSRKAAASSNSISAKNFAQKSPNGCKPGSPARQFTPRPDKPVPRRCGSAT